MMIAAVAILAFILALFLILKVVSVLVGLVWLLLIATLCGWIAESLLHYREGGIGTTAGVGLLGAVIGWVLAKVLHLPLAPHIAGLPILWTLVGSVALVAGLRVAAPMRRLNSGRRDVTRW
jgi:uncharacterized membrane protein YeaQ/YmgE (transglycosylase-associated protein family)